MSEFVNGMQAARQRAQDLHGVCQRWLKATSLAITDACKAAKIDEIPIWMTHSPIGTSLTFDVSLKGSSAMDFERHGIRLYTIEPYRSFSYDSLIDCQWLVRFMTLQSFLRRIIHKLAQRGLHCDGMQFRGLVALYLLMDEQP